MILEVAKPALSAMLGHFDAGFTLSTYAHATHKSQDDAAQKVGEFMMSLA